MGRAEVVMTGAMALALMSCDAAPTATTPPTPTAIPTPASTVEPTPALSRNYIEMRAQQTLKRFYPEMAGYPDYAASSATGDDWSLQLIYFSGHKISRDTVVNLTKLYSYIDIFKGRTLPIPGTDSGTVQLRPSRFRYHDLIVVEDDFPLPSWMNQDSPLPPIMFADNNLENKNEAAVVMVLPRHLSPDISDAGYNLMAVHVLFSSLCDVGIAPYQKDGDIDPDDLRDYVCQSLTAPLEARLLGQTYDDYKANMGMVVINVQTGNGPVPLAPLIINAEEYNQIPLIDRLINWDRGSAPYNPWPTPTNQNA